MQVAQITVDGGMRAAQQTQHGAVQREADPKTDERRQDERDDYFGDAVQMAVQQIIESPHHMVGAGSHHDHARQAADQCMR